jgi:hypothetical protein
VLPLGFYLEANVATNGHSIAHRLLTIFITAFAYASFEYCQSPVYLISLVIWLIQSTTDQIMYLALLGDTLKWDHVVVSQLYKIAAVQTGIFDVSRGIIFQGSQAALTLLRLAASSP